MGKPTRKINEQLEQTIITLTMQGYTRRQIAEAIGASKSTVYLYQKKNKLL